MLYRIAEASDWASAQETGFFASADLAAEGFIHSSERHQLLETARRYYAGRAGLVLFEIDEAQLTASGVRVERAFVPARGEAFAHLFGAVPLAAIGRHWPLAVAIDGNCALPRELLTDSN